VLLVTGATATATLAAEMEGGSGGEGAAAAAAAVARSLAGEMQRLCRGGGGEGGCRRGSRGEQQKEEEDESEDGDEDSDDWAVELLERDVAAARRFCALPAAVNVHLAETLGELISCSRSLLVPSLDQVVLLRFERDEVGLASGGGGVARSAAAVASATGGGAWHDDDGTGRELWLSEADRRAVRRLVAGDWRDRVSRVVVADRPLGLRADAGGGHEEAAAAEPAPPDGADSPGGRPRQQRRNGGGSGDPPRPLCAAPTFVCHGRDPGSVRAVARLLVRRALRGAAGGGLAGGRL
jgi:hypothetical protein